MNLNNLSKLVVAIRRRGGGRRWWFSVDGGGDYKMVMRWTAVFRNETSPLVVFEGDTVAGGGCVVDEQWRVCACVCLSGEGEEG
ncbi:hypothetical protein Acr_00g0057240 [Actinidia rufa]|uniref:Uncharacterized protein n=1 Tax=Actinidia rufa TaxID=165716 RepID=A0A7J0DMG5_9ERIC|nr:hypothetical protein Acr_00g0057240 [Actinidia rufa]